jgi:hypothetical protein
MPSRLTEQEQNVLAPLEALLEGIRRRDHQAMLAQVMPDGGATIIRGGRVLHYTLRALVERPFSDGNLDEQIDDPVILIDDDIAVIWVPYKFFINGKLHHWGTNVVNLVRQPDGRWLIAGIADNSRTPEG